MQLGLYLDILDDKSFTEALDYSAGLELDTVEIGTGNFSSSPHCRLDDLVQSQSAREELLGAITERGLTLSALNCSGNLIDPHPERRERCQQVYYDTIRVGECPWAGHCHHAERLSRITRRRNLSQLGNGHLAGRIRGMRPAAVGRGSHAVLA